MLVSTDQRSVLTKCMVGVDYVNTSLPGEHSQQMRTCFTSTVAELHSGQALQLEDVSVAEHHEYLNGSSANYFGVVQLRRN